MTHITAEIEQSVLENSEHVAALERLYEQARLIVNAPGCVAHDRRPCETCLTGLDDMRDLREAVEEVEVLR